MRSFFAVLAALLRWLWFAPSDFALENAALRQQNAILNDTVKRAGLRPRLRTSDRVFWVALVRLWSRWRSVLIVVRPATVIAWHNLGFRLFWRWKSQGRPAIEREHRDLIRRISREHPAWGEDRIRDELLLKLGVEHAASTVRKYMLRPEERGPIEERAKSQTWRTFLKNHAREVYACDFLVQWTATFRLVYVFIVMELGSRRVVHANVTSSPTLAWVKNQIREIAAWGEGPRFLIHDNDGIFGQLGRRKKNGFRSHLDRWLARVIGIEGIPIPYRAPNANAFVERFNLSLRREALDHFVFLNEQHVLRVVKEYVAYHNGARGHQGIGTIPDPYDELRKPPNARGCVVALPVLGGIQHDYRRAA